MKQLLPLVSILLFLTSCNWDKTNNTTPTPENVNYVVLEQDNTRNFKTDDFNLYGIIALVVALASLAVASITLVAQAKTEKHTRTSPLKDQAEKFKELAGQMYQKLVYTLACAIKYYSPNNQKADLSKKAYPTETFLQKVILQPEDIILNVDSKYQKDFIDLRLYLRSYSVEINVLTRHLQNPHFSDESSKLEWGQVLFKPMHLVSRVFDTEMAIFHSKKITKEQLLIRALQTIFKVHLNRFFDAVTSEVDMTARFERFDTLLDSVDSYGYIDRSIENALSSVGRGKQDDLFSWDSLGVNETMEIAVFKRLNVRGVQEALQYLASIRPQLYEYIGSYVKCLQSEGQVHLKQIFKKMALCDALVETQNVAMIDY